MRRLLLIGAAITQCGLASGVGAEPCVGETFERPPPGATDVVSHATDVPAARFPGFWQEGVMGGYRYQMFSNGDAILRSAGEGADGGDWTIRLTCGGSDAACAMTRDGSPDAAAVAVAEALGQCLLGAAMEAEAPPEPLAAIAPLPCGSQTVDEPNPVATLQRLLVIAGASPGPVDGILGPGTRRALETFVPQADGELSPRDAISTLDQVLCDRTG